jgi:hypothetical protein
MGPYFGNRNNYDGRRPVCTVVWEGGRRVPLSRFWLVLSVFHKQCLRVIQKHAR